MKLKDVKVVTEDNVDIVVDRPGDGGHDKHNATVGRRLLDFGPDNRDHEKHVRFPAEEFECDPHKGKGYHTRCKACREAVFGTDTTAKSSIATHLRESRGIVIEP